MKLKKLAAVFVAAALASTLSVPAFATDRTGDMTAGNEQITESNGNSVTTKDYTGALEPGDHFNADTIITADVKAPTAKVISVTLPSTMSIALATKYANVGGIQTAVFDAANTRAATATVKNSSKGAKVDISVASVSATGGSDALTALSLKLTPASSHATSVVADGVSLLTSTANASLITGLSSLAEDGTGTAGEATLSLSTTRPDGSTEIGALHDRKISLTTTLKVSTAAAVTP